MEKVEIQGAVNTTVFARLQKLIRESKNIPEFVKKIANEYSDNVDDKIDKLEETSHNTKKADNRAMFSSEIEEKILNQVKVKG